MGKPGQRTGKGTAQGRYALQTVPLPPAMVPLEVHPDPVKRKALAAYAKYGTVRAAMAKVNRVRNTWYDWRENDTLFRQLSDNAEEDVTDRAEEVVIKRALGGKSDSLLQLMLQSRRSGKYATRERITELSPGVRLRMEQTLRLIASKPTWESEALLNALEDIWK